MTVELTIKTVAPAASGGESSTWGGITGTLSAQTDLQAALDAKLDDSQVTAFGLSLLNDADAATARATLGLGSAALSASTDFAVTAHTHPLSALTGVVLTTPANGEVLKYNGTNWVNAADATGGGGVTDGDKGDITVSGTGATWTIDPATVTLGKMANLAANSIIGNNTGAGATPIALTAGQVKALLAIANTDVSGLGTASTFASTSFALAAHTHILANVTDVTMTVANLNLLDDGANTALHFHDADRARGNHTGTQLSSTISDFNEAAQDAIGLMVNSTLVYTDATPLLERAAITGHITIPAGSNASALGSFTIAQLNTAVSDADLSPTGHTHTLANVTDVTMTVANLNLLDDGVNTALHFHDADRARANHTGTQLAATISDFNTAADARVVAGITGKQPLDADLTALAALTGTNTIYYRSAADTWTAVTIGANLTFSGGTLAATGGSAGNLDSLTDVVIATPATNQILKFDGTNWINATVGGLGDVAGPASSVATQLATFGDATGKLIAANTVLVEAGGAFNMPEYFASSLPASPAAGRSKLFMLDIAGKTFPAQLDELGDLLPIYPDFTREGSFLYVNNGSTSFTAIGLTVTTAGTATAKQRSNTTPYNKTPLTELLVTVAATTAIVSARGSNLTLARQNGIFFAAKLGPATGVATTTHRFFCGLINSTTAQTDVEPSTQLNCFGIGYDAADTNLQFMHNDGTATCTKIDLGANFPVPTADRTQMYEVFIYAPAGGTTVTYRVVNTNTGVSAGGTTAASKLPAVTAYLAFRAYASVGGTSSVIGLGISYIRGFDAK